MRGSVVVLVALVAVLWFGRGWFSRDAAASVEPLANVVRAPGAAEEGGAGTVPRADTPVPGTAVADQQPAQEEDGVVAAILRRAPEALAAGYRLLLDADAGRREALVEALRTAAGESPAAMLAALGEGNAFLHSDPGRAAARNVLKAAAAEPAEAALRTCTGLIERAMRGSIEKADVEARALVDEIYAGMQSPLNRAIFNPEFTAGARTHQVARNESLDRIAAGYRKQGIKVDALTLGLFNRISDPTKLRQGQVLKIPVEPIITVIEKRSFLLAMYLGDVVFRLYWVGHGKDDRTPETTFTVGVKQEKPDWYFDGRVIPYGHRDNILGAYFVKFEHPSFPGYGAHGTPEPETIGTMASRGCIRMCDPDIREFFQVVPRGTLVHVRATKNEGSR
jgi:hypothetical protein